MSERKRIDEQVRALSAVAIVVLASRAAPAQAPSDASAPPESEPAEASASGSMSLGAGTTSDASFSAGGAATDDGGAASSALYGGFEPGFETGLRFGVGAPIGKAGESSLAGEVDVKELAALRVPVWVDVGYRLSERTTLGVYGQIGFGKTGDACVGECDWSDLRIGVQGQWRLSGAGANVKPWIGVGLGYESLSFRTLLLVPVMNTEGMTSVDALRAAQRLGGPELLLQLGLDFRVEDSLDVGPYVSATLAQYMSDKLTCDKPELCSGIDVLDGSGLHSWLGVGLRGSYLP